jgi:uncharacterized membrane protein YeaQ/YmgE (transglycosylase-associated protein family)
MPVLHWLLFGAALGIIAALVDVHPGKRSGGFLGRIILSITGVLLALFLAHLIFEIPSAINLMTVTIALYGALMFLFTGHGLRRL